MASALRLIAVLQNDQDAIIKFDERDSGEDATWSKWPRFSKSKERKPQIFNATDRSPKKSANRLCLELETENQCPKGSSRRRLQALPLTANIWFDG